MPGDKREECTVDFRKARADNLEFALGTSCEYAQQLWRDLDAVRVYLVRSLPPASQSGDDRRWRRAPRSPRCLPARTGIRLGRQEAVREAQHRGAAVQLTDPPSAVDGGSPVVLALKLEEPGRLCSSRRGLLLAMARRLPVGRYGRSVSLYALNLFDLADNEDYRAYSRRSVDAVGRHGGHVVALGQHAEHEAEVGDTEPRQALVLVEWRDREAFDAFLADPELGDLHPLRENGTRRYIWWTFDRLDDLRPLLRR